MIAYVNGKLTHKSPSYVIVDCQGVGYGIEISLHTWSFIQEKADCQLYTYCFFRDDVPYVFGFYEITEKELFLKLISVSGIGANTARMILSAYKPDEIIYAIAHEEVARLKSIKGIGPKTAQRVILELKDKVIKMSDEQSISGSGHNTDVDEALSALVMLGFPRNPAFSALKKIAQKSPEKLGVEGMIKEALKVL